MAKGIININNAIKAIPVLEEPPLSEFIGKEVKTRSISFTKRDRLEYGLDGDRGYILKAVALDADETVVLDFTGITTPGFISVVCTSGAVNLGFATAAQRPIVLHGTQAPSCMFHINSTVASAIYVGNLLNSFPSGVEFILFERNDDFTH